MEEPTPREAHERAIVTGYSAALSGLLQTALSHIGPHFLPMLAGTIGSVLLPMRDALKKYDAEGMPPEIIEFYNGIAAVVERVHASKPAIITPNAAES